MILLYNDINVLPCVTLAGSVHIPAPNKHFERIADEYILYHIKSGSMKLIENDIIYELSTGDILILEPGKTHYGLETASDVEYTYIHFTYDGGKSMNYNDNELHELILSIRFDEYYKSNFYFPKYCHHINNQNTVINNYLDEILLFENNNEIFKTHKTRATFLLLLSSLLLFMNKEANSAEQKLIDDLTSFIHANKNKNLSSTDFEEYFHMNFDYINRCFKKYTDSTLIHYHNQHRILEAKKMLKSGIYNIKQISELLGFSNEFYFSRVYKKYEGHSPSETIKT